MNSFIDQSTETELIFPLHTVSLLILQANGSFISVPMSNNSFNFIAFSGRCTPGFSPFFEAINMIELARAQQMIPYIETVDQ